MTHRRTPAPAVFLPLVALAVACSAHGGGSYVPVASQPQSFQSSAFGPAAASATPPSSVTAITPAPGYPTPPPLQLTLDAPTPYPASHATPRVVPLPTAVGGTQVGGSTLSSGAATALAGVLSTPEPDTLVYGTLEGYGRAELLVTTSPFLARDPKSSSAGTGRVSVPEIPLHAVFALNGKTVDAVPGGFRSLRTGDRVLVVAKLAHAATVDALYLTDLDALGKNVKRGAATASYAQLDAKAPDSAVDSVGPDSGGLSPQVAAPVKFALKGSTSPYAKGVVSPVEPALPYPIVLPFGTIDIQYEVSASYDESVDYPLELVDESATYPWRLKIASVLPIAVLNGKASSPTFTAGGSAVVALSAKVTYRGAGASGGGEFLLAQSSGGNDGDPAISFQSTSESKLLAPGATATVSPARKGEYTFDLPPSLEKLLETLEPGSTGSLGNYPSAIPIELEQYLDGTLTGSNLGAAFEITNASESSFDYAFKVDGVPLDPSLKLTPTGSPNAVAMREAKSLYAYNGKADLKYESTVSSPFGKLGPTALDTVDNLPNGETGFHQATFSPPPAIKLTPTRPASSICAHDTNTSNHDGGGSCGSSVAGPAVVLDIVSGSPATYKITDYTGSGLTKTVAFTVNPNDPPPKSLSGVPPYVCSSTNVTIQPPLTGKTNPWTVKVTVPPGRQVPKGGCGFSVSDANGAKIYVSLTDDVPSP
jgi:hypothetical protein